MILKIEYRSGEVRIINLHPAFFVSSLEKEFDKKLGVMRQVNVTPAHKAVSIAEDLGVYPYKILLERSGQVELDKVVRSNEPVPQASYKIDERKIKKQLRKEFKNVPLKTFAHLTF